MQSGSHARVRGLEMGRIGALLVDDDEGYATTLATFLGLHDDIEVLATSREGRQAVDEYRRVRPDVVVMDVYMPVMDGIEATRHLVSADPEARVVVLSAHDTPELRERVRAAGAFAFVPKQHATRGLVAEIRAAASFEKDREAPPAHGASGPELSEPRLPEPETAQPEARAAEGPVAPANSEASAHVAAGPCTETQVRTGNLVITIQISVTDGGRLSAGD